MTGSVRTWIKRGAVISTMAVATTFGLMGTAEATTQVYASSPGGCQFTAYTYALGGGLHGFTSLWGIRTHQAHMKMRPGCSIKGYVVFEARDLSGKRAASETLRLDQNPALYDPGFITTYGRQNLEVRPTVISLQACDTVCGQPVVGRSASR
jgi:hypothetical protein